ncbi:single-stranded DNA-binding protein [Candidatus Gracilibacteria bacterium]|nr:single-stranded DNA-binding protein [Candidatus Gracilibacteria bacterium]
MDLNKVQIIGRVTSEIELRTTPNGQNVANLSVATNRSWTDGSGMKQEQAEFHNVILWGKIAEIASQYLQKGKKVYIEGRLQTKSWEAQDGSKRYKVEIVGENMILLDSKQESSTQPDNYPTKPKPTKTKKDEEEINIEDIPF